MTTRAPKFTDRAARLKARGSAAPRPKTLGDVERIYAAAGKDLRAAIEACDAKGRSPDEWTVMVVSGDAPTWAVPPNVRHQGPSAYAVFPVDRRNLHSLLKSAQPDVGRAANERDGCGHYWVFVATREEGKYHCPECGFEVGEAASAN